MDDHIDYVEAAEPARQREADELDAQREADADRMARFEESAVCRGNRHGFHRHAARCWCGQMKRSLEARRAA